MPQSPNRVSTFYSAWFQCCTNSHHHHDEPRLQLPDAILAANQNQAVVNCEAGFGVDTIEQLANSLFSFDQFYTANQPNPLPAITEKLIINGHGSILNDQLLYINIDYLDRLIQSRSTHIQADATLLY